MAKTTVIEAFEITGSATKEAVMIRNPKIPLKMVWLPKSEIVSRSAVKNRPGYYLFEIPEWLASEKSL